MLYLTPESSLLVFIPDDLDEELDFEVVDDVLVFACTLLLVGNSPLVLDFVNPLLVVLDDPVL
ncbi:Uncharacterised protein [Chlamydia trachomatis]|nr:Uncharacterised protein [Chlamydia trachomatis]